MPLSNCGILQSDETITEYHLFLMVFLRFLSINCFCIMKNSCDPTIEGSIHLMERTCQRRINECGTKPSGIKIKLARGRNIGMSNLKGIANRIKIPSPRLKKREDKVFPNVDI